MNGISSNGSVIPYGAIVNSKGQQLVRAEGLVEEGAAAELGESWIISAITSPAATPEGGLLKITNLDPTYNLKIFRIYIYFSKVTGSNLDITQIFNAETTGGVDVSSTALVQKNTGFTTSSVFNLEILAGQTGMPLTMSNGIVYHPNIPAVSRTQNSRNMNGTNIITTNNSINFGYKTNDGANADATDLIGFAINVTQIRK